MRDEQLHMTQVSILHALRYAEAERFSDLMRPTKHTSDTFKFHVRKLIKLGLIEKTADSKYRLTSRGKEFANNLNERHRKPEKQPKISVLAVVTKVADDGRTLYLMQKRSRNPYYGYWSEIHGRAEWGEPFEATAKRQLERQTGLLAAFTVCGFRRVRDFDANNEKLLEDKLFVVLVAKDVVGELSNDYDGGVNAWLSLTELEAQEHYFPSTAEIIRSLKNGDFYSAQDISYTPEDY